MRFTLTRVGLVARLLACLAGCATASTTSPAHGSPARPLAGDSKDSHATRGVVRGFGPDRVYVNIAHEAIPGFMAAMTMSFEPREPSQLEGLAAGDRVVFAFVEHEDGRRVIERIARE
jgi:Cu/Ag efflux protein CusF